MKKTILITGASSGIGRALAVESAAHGHDVIIVARSYDKLHELKAVLEADYKITVQVIVADLSVASDVEKIAQALRDPKNDVMAIINNAGFGGQGSIVDRKVIDDLSMIDVNIKALVELSAAAAKHFVSQKIKGKIMNVASVAALIPGGPYQATYFATKAFVSSYTLAVANELSGSGVTATSLYPGATETHFAQKANLEDTKLFKGKLYSAESVATDGYRAMMRGDIKCVTAVDLPSRLLVKIMSLVPVKLVLNKVAKLQQNH